jgi:hypothetical protein
MQEIPGHVEKQESLRRWHRVPQPSGAVIGLIKSHPVTIHFPKYKITIKIDNNK